MTRLLLSLILIPATLLAQSPKVSEDSVIKKWSLAVINLEIDFNDNWYKVDRKVTGTAIFFATKNRHYLLTARHVLINPFNNDSNEICKRFRIIDNFGDTTGGMGWNSFILSGSIKAYELSNVHTDLALICLDRVVGGNILRDVLKNKGYAPININDIDTSNNVFPSQIIYAFGYPDISLVGIKNVREVAVESNSISIAVVSQGNVSGVKANSPEFYGNIFVAHGSSGGAIVSNSKLVGFVSRVDTVIKKSTNQNISKYIFGKLLFIKASYIMPLIREMDKRKEQFH